MGEYKKPTDQVIPVVYERGHTSVSNLDQVPVGKCGLCGGIVSVPKLWWGMNRPDAVCESCGATADTASTLPVLPMVKK